ncbi:hypothetical protein HK102_004554 [Quaeritorhiza haematococci]|nr:hypothetical protein HK102_004554 [Quaeritorhiza haematococci]
MTVDDNMMDSRWAKAHNIRAADLPHVLSLEVANGEIDHSNPITEETTTIHLCIGNHIEAICFKLCRMAIPLTLSLPWSEISMLNPSINWGYRKVIFSDPEYCLKHCMSKPTTVSCPRHIDDLVATKSNNPKPRYQEPWPNPGRTSSVRSSATQAPQADDHIVSKLFSDNATDDDILPDLETSGDNTSDAEIYPATTTTFN